MIGDRSLSVYEGVVFHQRHKPVGHKFSYRVFSFLVDLDKLDEIAQRRRLFSRNKFNLFSFYDRDHGAGRPDNITVYLRSALKSAGLPEAKKITALFYPKILGYAFNPLAVFFCYGASGGVNAIFYQVNNTFGERHTYLVPVERGDNSLEHWVDKKFHVSPFIEMEMRYRFRIDPPGEKIGIDIEVHDGEGRLLNAAFNGKTDMTADPNLGALFFRYPLMMIKVIAGIHYEALRLLAKGLRLRAGTPSPEEPVTVTKA